jgi:type I restriction enzyme S subunit
LIANCEAQKKALMQQLLTGIKRLSGIEGEWSRKTLSSLGKTYAGLSGKTKADFGSGKPFVPYKNVFANAELDMNELEYVSLSDGEKQNLVKSGDIIFTTSSETPEEVGMSSAVLTDIGQLYLNSFCFGFRIKKQNEFTPSFAKHLFRSAELRRAISSLAQGSTRYNLSKNEFLKINIHLPKRAEQEQIVEVLDAVETVHAKEQMKLKKLKSEKSALMQQLLTGKRRVKIEEDIIA